MIPPELQAWMREQERRVRALEFSPRLPALSLPGSSRGIQGTKTTGGSLTDNDTDDFSGSGQDLTLTCRAGAAGRFVLLYGMAVQVGGSHQANQLFMTPNINPGYDVPGMVGTDEEPDPVGAEGGSIEVRYVMTTDFVLVNPNEDHAVTVNFTQTIHVSDSGTGVVTDPWIIVIPL